MMYLDLIILENYKIYGYKYQIWVTWRILLHTYIGLSKINWWSALDIT